MNDMKFDCDKLLKIYDKNDFLVTKIENELKTILLESGWDSPHYEGDCFCFFKTIKSQPKKNGKRNRNRSIFVYAYEDRIKIRQTKNNSDKDIVSDICEEVSKLIFAWTKYGYIK